MHRRLRSPKPPRLQPAGQSVCGEASADRRTPGRYPRRMRARKAGPEAERSWTPVGCVISRARHLGENTTRRRYRRGHEPGRLPGGGCDRGPLDARARVLEAMRAWQARYGRLPSSYDWSVTHAHRRDREALASLSQADFPSSSVVTAVYRSWTAAWWSSETPSCRGNT